MATNIQAFPLSTEEQNESVDVLEVLPKDLDLDDVVLDHKTWKRIVGINKYRRQERVWLNFQFDDETDSAVPYDTDLKATVLRIVIF